jgi:hypothetical protein
MLLLWKILLQPLILHQGWDPFSNMGNPPHEFLHQGEMDILTWIILYHITFSSQVFPSGMIPSQPFISPTSASHVGDRSTTSASHVEDLQPATASHVGGTTLVTASHTGQTSPTSASHVGDQLLASASHAGSMSPATASHVGGIDTIEKPRRIGRKPKFLCILCKGGHLTHLCPATVMVREAWSLSDGPSRVLSHLWFPNNLILLWLMKRSCRCNIQPTPLLFWG